MKVMNWMMINMTAMMVKMQITTRLGRLRLGGARGPGIFFIIPCIDRFQFFLPVGDCLHDWKRFCPFFIFGGLFACLGEIFSIFYLRGTVGMVGRGFFLRLRFAWLLGIQSPSLLVSKVIDNHTLYYSCTCLLQTCQAILDQSGFRYHKVDLRTITLGVPPQEVWCSYLAFVTIPNGKIYNNIELGDFVHSNYLINFNLPSKLHFNWDALVFYKSMSPFWQIMYLIWIWGRWCKICRRICHQVDFNICQIQNFQNSSSFWFKFEGSHSRFCNNFCWRCCLLQASSNNYYHSIG